MPKIRVAQLQRYPIPGNYSVERIFEDVRAHLPPDVIATPHINAHPSQGVANRLRDAWTASRIDADVHHITGDVHYLAWFMPKDATLLTILDCVTLERLSGLKRQVFKTLWYDWPMSRSQMISTISTFSAQSIARYTGYDASKIAIIPPPLSDEFSREDREFASDRPRILQVGTTANKNVARVIQALSGLDVELVLIGELNDEYRARLAESGIAWKQLQGISREALLDEYRRADIVMFASTYEGFGMPIIEAQAIGRPVVTSDRCSMPEAAGDAALLVDPEDVNAIRSAVQSIIGSSDLRARLRETGFANAERFRPRRVADQYAELYRQLAR